MRSLTNEEMSVIAGSDFNGLFEDQVIPQGPDPFGGWDAAATRSGNVNSHGESNGPTNDGEAERFIRACGGNVECMEVVYKRYYG